MDLRDHEIGLAAFIVPARRDRFRRSLENPRLRRKLHVELYHFEHQLDPRFATVVAQHSKHDVHVGELHNQLVAAGAPASCVVIADGELDGQTTALRSALQELMISGGALLSCIPARLAVYIGEDGSEQFILRRWT